MTISVDTEPGAVGLDAHRLARLDRHFQRYVDDGRLPGWLLAIARHGDMAHLSMYGSRDIEAGQPVTPDTIWRIYSMTKPITAVAALVAFEQGAFELNDPVSVYLPRFSETRVWRSGSAVSPQTEPMTEPMRVWHLFTHTSGLTYWFAQNHPVDALYRQAGFEGIGHGDADLAVVCDRLAALPLLFQPGTEWSYGMSTDVLGMVVEAATGVPFADFLRREVLDPLGMTETWWSVDDDHADRLAALYTPMPGVGTAMRFDAKGVEARMSPAATLGGSGLVSTAGDYLRFAEMLRRRGLHDGGRILSPRTVDFMASNQLPGNADLRAFGRPLVSETTFDGVGFGLGVSVTIDPVVARTPGNVGEFGWGGAASTFFWVDPVDDLVVVFMTQLRPSSTYPLRNQLKQLVHAALVD